MRTLTTLALALAMLVTLASTSGATTTKKHHHKSHKKSSQAQVDAKAPKGDAKAAPATK